jgi:hypothetical protein
VRQFVALAHPVDGQRMDAENGREFGDRDRSIEALELGKNRHSDPNDGFAPFAPLLSTSFLP